MQAFIFAAGKGTRLKELTLNKPKALVEYQGEILLNRVIKKLKKFGYNNITINIHHFGHKIIDYINENNNFDVKINISDESHKLLETGGGLLHAIDKIDTSEPILLYNVDIISDIDLNEMANFHSEFSPFATLAIRKRNTSRSLDFDQRMRLVGRTNDSLLSYSKKSCCNIFNYGFSGIHIVSPKIFPLLINYQESNGDSFSIMDFYISICNKMNIIGYLHNYGIWFDAGKFEDYQK